MFKHPLSYLKEDIGEIMNIPIILDIGSSNSDEITETIQGIIFHCSLAGNSPNQPVSVKIELNNGEIRSLSMFEIKRIRSN